MGSNSRNLKLWKLQIASVRRTSSRSISVSSCYGRRLFITKKTDRRRMNVPCRFSELEIAVTGRCMNLRTGKTGHLERMALPLTMSLKGAGRYHDPRLTQDVLVWQRGCGFNPVIFETSNRHAPPAIPQGTNQRWSLDILSDAFANGRRFRVLVMVADFTRECLALVVDTPTAGPAGLYVSSMLASPGAGGRRCPRPDNGTELTYATNFSMRRYSPRARRLEPCWRPGKTTATTTGRERAKSR